MARGRSKEIVVTNTELGKQFDMSDVAVRSWNKELLGVDRITSEDQLELITMALKMRAAGMSKSQIKTALKGEKAFTGQEISPEPLITIKSSDKVTEMPQNNQFELAITEVLKQLTDLNQKIDKVLKNGNVRASLNKSTIDNEKRRIQRKIFVLHQEMGVRVEEVAVFGAVGRIISNFGIGPLAVAVEQVKAMVEQGGFTNSKGNENFIGLIYSTAEKLFRDGNYNDDDYISLLEYKPSDNEETISHGSEEDSRIAYINNLVRPYTNRNYMTLTRKDYYEIILDHISTYRNSYVDPITVYEEIKARFDKEGDSLIKEITGPFDTPVIDINKYRRAN